MSIQFFTSTIVALFCLIIWSLDKNAIQMNQLWVVSENIFSLKDFIISSVYIIFTTVISYFVFNYAIEKLNQVSQLNDKYDDGAKVSSYLASLEPLTACLIAIYAAGETKWYLLGSIAAFLLYMVYLSKRNSLILLNN
jgi:drug/metabolite transporter (DMT)-like permease